MFHLSAGGFHTSDRLRGSGKDRRHPQFRVRLRAMDQALQEVAVCVDTRLPGDVAHACGEQIPWSAAADVPGGDAGAAEALWIHSSELGLWLFELFAGWRRPVFQAAAPFRAGVRGKPPRRHLLQLAPPLALLAGVDVPNPI